MAKDKDKVAETPTAYFLGPQSDGSIVIRLPDDWHLMLARKALEKNRKNADAAHGTLSALSDGDDPWLDKVKAGQDKVLTIFNRARAPENQISDTPIGKEMAQTQAESSGAGAPGKDDMLIDGTTSRWAEKVPRPRPKLGDWILYPNGLWSAISRINGYLEKSCVFDVNVDGSTTARRIIPHIPQPDDIGYETLPEGYRSLSWRQADATYLTKLVEPQPFPDADDPPMGTDAAGEPQQVAPAAKGAKALPEARPGGKAQRAKNAERNGLAPSPKKRGGKDVQ